MTAGVQRDEEFALVGAAGFIALRHRAVVTRDVPTYTVMAGVPARRVGWMGREGTRLLMALPGEGEAITADGAPTSWRTTA